MLVANSSAVWLKLVEIVCMRSKGDLAAQIWEGQQFYTP